MTDFHTHILPEMDDGSASVEQSVQMLDASAAQGVTTLALTPHFYADSDSPEDFLRRRADSMAQLNRVRKADHPRLLAGAEVCYFPGIHNAEEIRSLRLEGTEFLLLEMPFAPWSVRVIEEVIRLNHREGVQVVLAHIDRYLRMQKMETIYQLLDAGVLLQANADSFLTWRERRRMLRLMEQGCIAFLGSDCHNMDSRPSRIGEALKVIEKKLGPDAIQWLESQDSLISGVVYE